MNNQINIVKMVGDQSDSKYSIKCALQSFIATYISGILHPLDLLKTRFQSHDGKSQMQNLVPKYNGIINGLRTIYKMEGLKGMYKGFHISLFSQATATAIFFWLYELQKGNYQKKGYSAMNSVLIASIQASVFGTLVTQPMWVIKTRMLLNTTSGISEIRNLMLSCKQIQHQGSFKGYSKGLGLSLILSVSGVIQMYSYEGLKRLYEYFHFTESPLQEKHFICGSGSKLFVILLSYPITTVRTRIQQNQFVINEKTQKYSSIREIFKKTLSQQGIRGFYKGFEANLLKGILQKGIYFYAYELLKLKFIKRQSVRDNN